MKIAQSPLSALRASRGDWLIFTLGLREISSLQFTRPEDLYSPIVWAHPSAKLKKLKILKSKKPWFFRLLDTI